MIRLSIIIPFYNVEKYIAECLDSVFEQDIPEWEYEVICVNDGSPDGSRDIVTSYLPSHANLKLIDHPRNMKLGATRNTGRQAARGNYIWFVDSDDKIAPNCINQILQTCEERDLDVLEMCYINMYENGEYCSTSQSQMPRDSGRYTGPEYMEKFHIPYFMGGICAIWRKVYKRSFLERNKIYSPPINMGEDEPFAIEIFGLANRMAYLDQDYYYYRRTKGSLSGEEKKFWSAEKWYETTFDATYYMHRAYQKVKANCSILGQQKLKEMIRYQVSLWRSTSFDVQVNPTFWTLVRKNFWKNRFIFLYLSPKTQVQYVKKVIRSWHK